MQLNLTLAAGVGQEFIEEADFFRVLDSSVSDLVVVFYKAGAEVSRAEAVTAGYGEKFNRGTFDKIRISSATGGTVSIALRLGNDISYDKPPTGNVTIANPVQASATQGAAAVTNASAQLLAANADRKYLLIQNKSASGSIWLNLAGNAATTANGVKLGPGDAYEMNCATLTGAIFAIGDLANNPDVVTVEA